MTDDPPSPDGPDEFPTEEELPDEPVTMDDIDPFTVDDDDFDDINDFAVAEWKNETSANAGCHRMSHAPFDPGRN